MDHAGRTAVPARARERRASWHDCPIGSSGPPGDLHAFWRGLRGGAYKPPSRLIIEFGSSEDSFFESQTGLLVFRPRSLSNGLGGALVELAHEYGHAVQGHELLEKLDRHRVAMEAHADCFAGLWLGNALARGKVTDDEVEEARQAIRETGGSPAHPTPTNRLIWFLNGLNAKPGHPPFETCPLPAGP
ncbi:MAG TPA: hypothetical protein VGF25_07955 [Thermoleophilaceae bacterium]|jgi:hypothetical protein